MTAATGGNSYGGYDAAFVQPLDKELECPICLYSYRLLAVISCCVDEITEGGMPSCPLDNKVERRREVFLDKIHERKVLDLDVKCNNHSEGCTWIGELRNLKMKKKDVSDHEDKCSKEHMRLLLKNVEDLKAQFRCRPSKSCKFMWSRKLERSR
ncbi:TNF receptor-associated factor 6-like [Corticium candelabrum]|uniref:TNF receptor-associated factor 6-like n=1 Tax=Corticium candelabrum TaxID=121492 RepID=UPI002E268CF3|nr:TNF receptor-associated factor 6-like [Corticium candelabrum]